MAPSLNTMIGDISLTLLIGILLCIIIAVDAVLLTADHSHTMTIGGYNSRFHDITGTVDDPNDSDEADLADDGRTWTVLSYGNGPGFKDMVTTGAGDWTSINRSTLDRDAAADYG